MRGNAEILLPFLGRSRREKIRRAPSPWRIRIPTSSPGFSLPIVFRCVRGGTRTWRNPPEDLIWNDRGAGADPRISSYIVTRESLPESPALPPSPWHAPCEVLATGGLRFGGAPIQARYGSRDSCHVNGFTGWPPCGPSRF